MRELSLSGRLVRTEMTDTHWSGLWQTDLFLGPLTCERCSAGLSFWWATCPRPVCWRDLPRCLDSGKVQSWCRAALPPDDRGRAPSPLSADKLHSCGVTCQHLHLGSPETNQECSACQRVALSHYFETTFLREPWALSEEEEWGIHWRSDPQPCNERQPPAARPVLQLKEKMSCKNVLNPCSICCVDTTLISNNSHGI